MIKVNEYFDGKVKSMACNNGDGQLTVGVMESGKYTFGTSQKEFMFVVSGCLLVTLPGESTPEKFTKGQDFIVEANSSFDVEVVEETIYTCRYE